VPSEHLLVIISLLIYLNIIRPNDLERGYARQTS